MRGFGYPYGKDLLRLPGSTPAPGISGLLAPVGTSFPDPSCASDPRQLRHPQTPLGSSWTASHPRFHFHFIPAYSSWLNGTAHVRGAFQAQVMAQGSLAGAKMLQATIAP